MRKKQKNKKTRAASLSDCRKSRFSARYCFELIALRPRHICLRSGSIWQKPSNHRLGFGAAPFSQKSSKIFGRPYICFPSRSGNVAISCRKRHEIGEKFHCRAAVAMTAGGSRPSLTEARAETAWLSRGRRLDQNEIFRKIGVIDTLKDPRSGSFLIRLPGRKRRQVSQDAKQEKNYKWDEEKSEKNFSPMAAAWPAQKQNQKDCQPDGQQQKKCTVLRVCTGNISADQRNQHSGCAAAAAVKAAQPINDARHRLSPRFLAPRSNPI